MQNIQDTVDLLKRYERRSRQMAERYFAWASSSPEDGGGFFTTQANELQNEANLLEVLIIDLTGELDAL